MNTDFHTAFAGHVVIPVKGCASMLLAWQHATFCCAVRVPATRTLLVLGQRFAGKRRDEIARLSVTAVAQFATGLTAGGVPAPPDGRRPQ